MLAKNSVLATLTWLAQAAVLSSAPPEQTSVSAAFEEIDRHVSSALAGDGHASVTIGLVVDNRLAHRAAFGYADDENETKATSEHVYRIGSITKQFTAYAILKLSQEGKLRLSQPLTRYVPEAKAIAGMSALDAPITILQVATMTSGLSREPDDLPRYLVGPAEEWFSVVNKALPAVAIEWEPDTRYQYSNIGYAMLRRVVEKASGRSYMNYIREEFLIPLGMTDTDFVPQTSFRDRIAKGYVIDQDTVDAEQPMREHSGRGYKVPNGALYSTVTDLAAFLNFQMGGGPDEVVDSAAVEENLSRVNSADGSLTRGYGLGFQVHRRGELVMFGHGGSVAGYRAGAYFEPERKLGVVLLRNATGGTLDVTELARDALEMLVDEYDRLSPSAP